MRTRGVVQRQAAAPALAAAVLALYAAAGLKAQEPEEKKVEEHVIVRTFGGERSQSFLGVNVWEVNAETVREKGLPEERGVLITSVVPDSAADRAGLKKGDVIIEYNGQRVQGVQQFIRLVRETPVGRKITLKVIRDGQELTLTATMGERRREKRRSYRFRIPEFRAPKIVIPDIPRMHMAWRSVRLGILGEALEGQLAEYFGVEKGVLVRSVQEDSPAARAGIRAGDVIVEVEGEKVETPREIARILRRKGAGRVQLKIVRERKETMLEVELEQRRGDLRRRGRLTGSGREPGQRKPPGRRISAPATAGYGEPPPGGMF